MNKELGGLYRTIEQDIRELIFSHMILGGSAEEYDRYLASGGFTLRCVLLRPASGAPAPDGLRTAAELLHELWPDMCLRAYDNFILCLCFDRDGEAYPDGRALERFAAPRSLKSYVSRQAASVPELAREYQELCARVEADGVAADRDERIFRLYALEGELINTVLDGDADGLGIALRRICELTDSTNGHDLVCDRGYFSFLWRYMDRVIYQRAGARATIPEKLSIDRRIQRAAGPEEATAVVREFLISYMEHLKLGDKCGGHRIIEHAKLYIRDNCAQDISLEAVSREVGLSSAYLSRLFKKEEGMNYKDYLSLVRMEKAAALLREGKLNVSQVAQEVGYASLKNFSAAFKSYFGVTAREMRRGG